jgi:hypothetical protein
MRKGTRDDQEIRRHSVPPADIHVSGQINLVWADEEGVGIDRIGVASSLIRYRFLAETTVSAMRTVRFPDQLSLICSLARLLGL